MGDIAHIRDDGKIQTVEEHCLNVAKIASKLGKYYHLENVMFIAGLLHDCGKFSEEFQEYIQKANAGENVHRGEVNHSSAGGIYCDQIFTTEDNMYQLRAWIEIDKEDTVTTIDTSRSLLESVD